MTRHLANFSIAVVAVAWLSASTPALASPFGVKDDAALFSADAVRQAEEQIQTLHRRARQDLLIETISAVPADKAGPLKSNRNRFFAEWAQERAEVSGVNGVYVLICAEPRHVQVFVSPDAREAFPDKDREKLRKSLSGKLGRKAYDDALLDAVESVRDRLDPSHVAAARANWWWVLWVILGIVGVWLVVGLVRSLLGSSAGQTPGAGPGGGILAGMFGASAGSWIYHALFRRRGGDQAPQARIIGHADERIRAKSDNV
jgi:uncharacterized membrane protein YgcG